ncbi:MAG: hypothetical protein Q7U20_07715 [Caulobacter sp.]|nr:hypothetical protein [Caulobacter sp.]
MTDNTILPASQVSSDGVKPPVRRDREGQTKTLDASAMMTRTLRIAVTTLALVAATSAVAAQPSRPTKAYCEANLIQAQRAADAAQSTTVATVGAGVGGGTLLICLGASAIVGYLDMGLMTLLCTAAGAAATGATAPDAAGQAAHEAFLKHRDPRCLDREGR